MSLKLSSIIKNTQLAVLAGIAEAQADGAHVLPPMQIEIEVGLSHGGEGGGYKVSDFNDVAIAKARFKVDLFDSPATYELAIMQAMDAVDQHKTREKEKLEAAGKPAESDPFPPAKAAAANK